MLQRKVQLSKPRGIYRLHFSRLPIILSFTFSDRFRVGVSYFPCPFGIDNNNNIAVLKRSAVVKRARLQATGFIRLQILRVYSFSRVFFFFIERFGNRVFMYKKNIRQAVDGKIETVLFLSIFYETDLLILNT